MPERPNGTPVMTVARPTSTLNSEARSARVDQLVLDVKAIGARTGKLTDDMRGTIARLNEVELELRAIQRRYPRSFMARLRWLVRG